MSIVEIKEELHNTIDSIDDKEILKAVLTILTPQIHTSYNELEEKQLKILKEREEKYLRGKTSTVSLEEFKLKMKQKYGL